MVAAEAHGDVRRTTANGYGQQSAAKRRALAYNKKVMLKEFFIVGAGSFMGGGARFVVSKALQTLVAMPFPLGTFVVNITGCLLIGFFSALNYGGGYMTPATKLLLTTGFCGGFTTFSTFVNESASLGKDGSMLLMALYVGASVAVGFVCLLVGNSLAKAVQ